MNSVRNAQSPDGIYRITSFVGSLVYPQRLPTVLKHLRHEGHSFQLAFRIKCPKNLLFTFDLNPVARSEFHLSVLYPFDYFKQEQSSGHKKLLRISQGHSIRYPEAEEVNRRYLP